MQSPARPFALRFISGKYQGGEFPLPSHGEVVIGRSSELDMVLVEDMVSRRHAKITVSTESIRIQDLGSTNGSFVNGEKIKQTELGEGDRILIGTSIIKLVATDDPATLDEARNHLRDVSAARRTTQVRTMTGSIAEVPLPDLLQLFSASKKSGVLSIRMDKKIGHVFLDKGAVAYASIEGLSMEPEKAFYRLLMWNHGTFDMDPPVDREFPQRIEASTEALLMEGMRQLDERMRFADLMPEPSATVRLARPLPGKVSELEPDIIDMLQLVHDESVVQNVLNAYPASDLDTTRVLVQLIQQGFVIVH